MRPRTMRRQLGFTLLEVLVAFVILVGALPVLYAIFSNGLRGTTLSEDYQRAVSLAESQLEESGMVAPPGGAEQRTTGDGRYTVTVTAEPYWPWRDLGEEQLAVRLYHVSVQVGWQQHGRQRRVSLSTVKLVVPPAVPGS